MSFLASFEGRYPKNLFNKSVVAGDNQTLIGHVAKETNELIVVFSESDRKVRFDIPKSEIAFTGSSVVMNNTADIQKYKVYRDTPLPLYFISTSFIKPLQFTTLAVKIKDLTDNLYNNVTESIDLGLYIL
jgi:hypothetical protein